MSQSLYVRRASQLSKHAVIRAGVEATAAFRRAIGHQGRPPSFLVIGAQKAGTTSLFDTLCRQGGISAPITKEVHYFTKYFERRPWSWYLAHFSGDKAMITGEATPYYLYSEKVPARVSACLPDCKLIVILRDPVERAYSHYNHELKRGRERVTFAEAVRIELEHGAGHDGDKQSKSYLERGIYHEQMKRWLDCFPLDAFYIVDYRDLFLDYSRHCDGILRHIGVEGPDNVTRVRKNAGSYVGADQGLLRELYGYFSPQNERLFDLLGTRFDWAPR